MFFKKKTGPPPSRARLLQTFPSRGLTPILWHEFGLSAGMKLPLLCFAVAVALYACSRDEPAVGQTTQNRAPPARIDETRQAEKAADTGKPLSDASLTQIVRSALESE